MSHSYSKNELLEYFYEALALFNEKLDTDISEDTVLVEFFTTENGETVYERFCSANFPQYLSEPFREDGYFDDIAAQAFVNGRHYGVLIREDIDFTLGELLQVFLHEISHLFCCENEIEDGNFFDKYCMGIGPEDGMMNAGYSIWREAVADIMADSMLSEDATMTLGMVKEPVLKYYLQLSATNPVSKKAMALIIVYIMVSREVATITDWKQAEKEIKKKIGFNDPLMYAALKQVFDKLHDSPFWVITPEFIISLGETYLSLLAGKAMRAFLTSADNG